MFFDLAFVYRRVASDVRALAKSERPLVETENLIRNTAVAGSIVLEFLRDKWRDRSDEIAFAKGTTSALKEIVASHDCGRAANREIVAAGLTIAARALDSAGHLLQQPVTS
ncbi:MAG: hypothetical protein ACKVX7_16350 [Planctomycetota bacterium]